MLALAIPTTSLLSGLANTTASFLFSAIVIKLPMCVASPAPAMIRPTSTVSPSANFSYAVFLWPVVAVVPSEPACSDTLETAVTSV